MIAIKLPCLLLWNYAFVREMFLPKPHTCIIYMYIYIYRTLYRDCYGVLWHFWPYVKTKISIFNFIFHFYQHQSEEHVES